jgi:hypothetical protein
MFLLVRNFILFYMNMGVIYVYIFSNVVPFIFTRNLYLNFPNEDEIFRIFIKITVNEQNIILVPYHGGGRRK